MSTQRQMPRLPGNTDRLACVGRTGTGKTIAALWHLSKRNYERLPWLVYNFKNDEHIEGLVEAGAITVDLDFVPKKKNKGIFVVNPLPNQTEDVAKQMWAIWAQENCGVYVDEGYMVGNDNDAFNALLTQGRSKHIPMIILSQRPVWMSRFVFSEANYYQVFDLNDKRDKKTITELTPITFETRLPDYHSYYYDVGRNQVFVFKPVPTESKILASFHERLSRGTRFI